MIISVDQSTSGTKALLFDEAGQRLHRANREHRQYYPQPGWVEHDPEEIYDSTCAVIRELIAETGVSEGQIDCLSITNQRETVVLWDGESGRPLCNALVWQDGRAAAICREIASDAGAVAAKTGLPLDPYFSAGKAAWALRNVDAVKTAATVGSLRIGTIDSWLIYKLTRGTVHATDVSNACRTLLFDIHERRWDSRLAAAFGIPLGALPVVRASNAEFGRADADDIGLALPIRGVAGDSHAALFGQRGFAVGEGKVTYGTGSSVMVNIGSEPTSPPDGIALSVGWSLDDEVSYVFEGNVHATGDTVRWAVENLGLASTVEEAAELAYGIESSDGVMVVPAFAGLGAPYWDNDARAVICGITRGTDRRHVLRAAFDSIAHQVADVIDAMRAGVDVREVSVDGGPARNRRLMQLQADLCDGSVVVPAVEELSALGAAFLGGYGTVWRSLDDIRALPVQVTRFTPKMSGADRLAARAAWRTAVSRTR